MSKVKIKNEDIFEYFASKMLDNLPEKNSIGRQQFFDNQSLGKIPESPDPYYLALVRGKREFDFLTSEYRNMYISGEWWGFYLLWLDWKGNRWILPELCSWYSKLTGLDLPVWLNKEVSEEERKRISLETDIARYSMLDISKK